MAITSQAALEIILQAKDQASDAISGITGKLGGLGTIAGGAALAGVAAVGAGLAAVGKVAFDFSQDVDESMRLLQAQTGASAQELESFKGVALDVYSSGWGESVADVSAAMATVNQVLEQTGDELESSTQKAFVMRDAFGMDVSESIAVVDRLVTNFGISSDEAFDLLTTGFQSGLGAAGDLQDTLREYSSDFERMGFTAEEMLSVLNAGLEAGAYNTDVIADGIREFNIRLKEGSEESQAALNLLFEDLGDTTEIDHLNFAIETTKNQIANFEQALEDNSVAMEEAEGLYAASAEQVKELSDRLNEARQELRDLAAPELVGMEEMDDQIFGVQQSIKQAKLELLALPEGTAEYDTVKARLDGLNTELERLQLERDITFDAQLREIEKAAKAGTEEAVTFDQAMADIADKKSEIEGLSSALVWAESDLAANADAVQDLKDQHDALAGFLELNQENLSALQVSLENASTPAKELLQQLSEGSLTGADALQMVTEALAEIEDPLERNRIGAALFGSKWEDLGEDVFLAAGRANEGLEIITGATDTAGESMNTGLGPALENLKRTAETALVPLGDMLAGAIEGALPLLESAAAWLGDAIPVAIDWFKTKLDELQPVFDWLSTQFTNFKDTLFPKLKEAWDLITTGFEQAKELYNNELKPALEGLFEKLGLGTDTADGLGGSLGNIVGTMATWVAGGLIDTIKLGIEGLTTVINIVTTGIDGLKKAWDNLKIIMDIIKGVFDDVKAKINDLLGSLGDLHLPDWLVPGSPTPLELGLRGISAAMDEINNKPLLPGLAGLSLAPAPGLLAPAPATAGVGGGPQIVIHNYFGRDSVRSDEDVLEIARRQEEALLLRGVRSFPT
jgi:phage-related minor tail protein